MMAMVANGNHNHTLFTLASTQATEENTQVKKYLQKSPFSSLFPIPMASGTKSTIETNIETQEGCQNNND